MQNMTRFYLFSLNWCLSIKEGVSIVRVTSTIDTYYVWNGTLHWSAINFFSGRHLNVNYFQGLPLSCNDRSKFDEIKNEKNHWADVQARPPMELSSWSSNDASFVFLPFSERIGLSVGQRRDLVGRCWKLKYRRTSIIRSSRINSSVISIHAILLVRCCCGSSWGFKYFYCRLDLARSSLWPNISRRYGFSVSCGNTAYLITCIRIDMGL